MRAISFFAFILITILLPVLKAHVDANEKKRSPVLYADHWNKRSLDTRGFQARAEQKIKKVSKEDVDVVEEISSPTTTSSSLTTRRNPTTTSTKTSVQAKKPASQQKQPDATATHVNAGDTITTTSAEIAQPSDVESQDGPDNQLNGQQPNNNPSQNGQNIPAGNAVPTESNPAGIVLVATVGCVFVAAFGLFAFVRKKKRREMAESIVATSASAWENQTNVYQKVDDNSVKSYTVIKTYIPTLSDELDIQLGDKVTILEVYDDGWVQGINETRGGIKGVFPLNCVDVNVSPNDKRSSSVGAYTVVDLN